MDSPEAAKITTTTATTTNTSSGSPPVQDSPFSNYVSNLSPIKPVKGPHVAQGFLGLNSPPLVFTSPHINPIRETSFLKRPQFPQLSSAEIVQNDVSRKKFADGSCDLEKSVTQLCNELITDTQKNSDTKKSAQVQPSRSSSCVDEYLANHVEVDCANSAYSVNPNLKHLKDGLQSSLNDLTDSKKVISECDNKNDMGTELVVPLALSEQAEEDLQGKSNFDFKPVKIEVLQSEGEWLSNECPYIEYNLSIDNNCEKQQRKNSGAQNAGGCLEDDSDCSPQLLPEPMQIVRAYEDCSENVGAISLVDNTMHDLEASQQQRGMSRRCLQFEEAQPKTIVSSNSSLNPANNVGSSRSSATTAEFDSLDSSHMDLNVASSKRQLVSLSRSMSIIIPPRYNAKSPLTVSKPSGIGLHLNSIVKAVPMDRGATLSMKLADVTVQQMESASATDDRMLETKTSIAASYATSDSFHTMEPLSLWLPIEDHATPHNNTMFKSEHTDSFEEFMQSSPKKKRKKSSSTSDGDGCKRCNCKKTKCLKLYCDCFAAGIYCAEPCACQGCLNRPEYEDTVLETRQQIESRNPLAFAPKIVQRVIEIPANNREDGNRLTPSSARHKRGCNCKKSMCLKKYCECYQANVGCSSGCRCEGCKNIYGRKEEYGATDEMVSNRTSEEKLDGTFDDNMEMVAAKKDQHNLTPLTPSFQSSDHGKDAPKSRLLSRRYLPSPESDIILSSCAKSPRSPKHSDGNDVLLEASQEILDVGSYGRGMDYNNTDMVDQFSPRCDALADICHHTPVPSRPSMAMASSASSKARSWTDVSQLQQCPGSGRLSGGSLRWRSSPITPMIRLGGTKNLPGLDSNSGLYDVMEDDTPEILKDASTPMKSLKVSSPNRKRVSPPHSRVHERGSSSSGGLRSGRKFILKAVPSFPPLTPCIDTKGSTNENPSDCQENSGSK